MITFSSTLSSKGLPTFIKSEDDLNTLMNTFQVVVKGLNLWQYYVLDTAREKDSIKAALSSNRVTAWSGTDVAGKSVVELAEIAKSNGLIIGLGRLASRYGVRSDPNAAAGLVKAAFVSIDNIDALTDAWVRVVDVINVPLYQEWEEDTRVANDNVRNRIKYVRLDPNGPKLGEISKNLLRREVIVWGDCVKLRYGSGPDDNPWLWEHMTSYVTSLAASFDGFRIDNCHSTPLEVGVWMLDAARVVNPDLYVCAELFTGTEEMDLLFVKRLGINSLIRESYNGWDPKEYSRLLYRYGVGKPIGSMDAACLTSIEEIPSPTGKGPVRKAIVTPLNGSMPHALLYDLTHDNESPMHKRSAEDALSTGALVTISHSATGSVKGL
ncbi:hypothetical protein MPER_11198, partial [Moniliophthora perniciosa FA553]